MPYGILRRSGAADVALLATEPGPVKLYPALEVEPQATIAEFDSQYRKGLTMSLPPQCPRNEPRRRSGGP
jgi:hypothetical protein